MRLKCPQSFLYFTFLIQVTLAYPKNEQRIKSKNYYSTNWSNPASTTRPIISKYNVDRFRHSSKFPNLDQLKTRIAGLNSDLSTFSNSVDRNSDAKYLKSDTRWSDTGHRLRHHGWSNRNRYTTTTTTTRSLDEELFNNYGELDDDEMEDDYPEDLFNSVVNDDQFDSSNFQAEEPTSTQKSTPEPRKYASLSEYKWEQLGTRQGVQKARKSYMQQKDTSKKSSEESKTTAVVEHYIRVTNSGQCKRPIPKVIPVHLEHPNPSVTYIPHCTVLHRCAEDTGCCKYDATCQYKEREEVTLYFYVKQIGADEAKVEKLTFYNHTECECKEKNHGRNDEQLNTTERQKRVASSTIQSFKIDNANPVKTSSNNIPESLLQKCKCPKEFLPKIKFGLKCFCDCDNNNDDCVRMKKGKEYNSLIDRMCIQKRECGTINCEYGPYNKLIGRCPRYDEA
ncbi:hypothetical protein ABEB36_006006 [Hypothenemus hampei]|uniref:Platelet-derived growth factor (PDGF) family profile domain-containing protein n=1 Tax=Hypothenemus hampei TaxID=57062 RepID=A0ABD1F0T4_HYPHA